jgi:Ca2+/H+ antiporter
MTAIPARVKGISLFLEMLRKIKLQFCEHSVKGSSLTCTHGMPGVCGLLPGVHSSIMPPLLAQHEDLVGTACVG